MPRPPRDSCPTPMSDRAGQGEAANTQIARAGHVSATAGQKANWQGAVQHAHLVAAHSHGTSTEDEVSSVNRQSDLGHARGCVMNVDPCRTCPDADEVTWGEDTCWAGRAAAPSHHRDAQQVEACTCDRAARPPALHWRAQHCIHTLAEVLLASFLHVCILQLPRGRALHSEGELARACAQGGQLASAGARTHARTHARGRRARQPSPAARPRRPAQPGGPCARRRLPSLGRPPDSALRCGPPPAASRGRAARVVCAVPRGPSRPGHSAVQHKRKAAGHAVTAKVTAPSEKSVSDRVIPHKMRVIAFESP